MYSISCYLLCSLDCEFSESLVYTRGSAVDTFFAITNFQSKIKAGKAGVLSVYIGTLILVAAHGCRIALHFAFKSEIKSQCQTDERQDYPQSSTAEIADWCDSDWRNDIW